MTSNWCWGKGSWLKPPYSIFFHTSCNKHDELYEEWWDWFDRYIADKTFLILCLKDAYYFGGIYAPYYMVWSYVYYLGVRIWGWRYFNYKYKNDTKD